MASCDIIVVDHVTGSVCIPFVTISSLRVFALISSMPRAVGMKCSFHTPSLDGSDHSSWYIQEKFLKGSFRLYRSFCDKLQLHLDLHSLVPRPSRG